MKRKVNNEFFKKNGNLSSKIKQYERLINFKTLKEVETFTLKLKDLDYEKVDEENDEELIDKVVKNHLEFINYDKLPKSDCPTFNLVIGQPGSGKSSITTNENLEETSLIIDTDIYRKYHPINKVIDQLNEGEMGLLDKSDYSSITQKFAAKINDKLREGEIYKNKGALPDLVFETTTPASWMEEHIFDKYKKLGYKINISFISTNPDISNFSQMYRGLETGRLVDYDFHEFSLERIESFFSIIEKYSESDSNVFNEISLHTRHKKIFTTKNDMNTLKETYLELQKNQDPKDLTWIQDTIVKLPKLLLDTNITKELKDQMIKTLNISLKVLGFSSINEEKIPSQSEKQGKSEFNAP